MTSPKSAQVDFGEHFNNFNIFNIKKKPTVVELYTKNLRGEAYTTEDISALSEAEKKELLGLMDSQIDNLGSQNIQNLLSKLSEAEKKALAESMHQFLSSRQNVSINEELTDYKLKDWRK